jgi:hypothetical protein
MLTTRIMPISIWINKLSTRTSPEKSRSMLAWSWSVQFLPVLPRLFHGLLPCVYVSPHTMIDSVLSGINPCTIRKHQC